MLTNLGFNQIATVTQSIVEQATGRKQITPTNTSEFVAIGQLALATGYDNVINAISQVLSRTIFSIRPYNRKFRGLRRVQQLAIEVLFLSALCLSAPQRDHSAEWEALTQVHLAGSTYL